MLLDSNTVMYLADLDGWTVLEDSELPMTNGSTQIYKIFSALEQRI